MEEFGLHSAAKHVYRKTRLQAVGGAVETDFDLVQLLYRPIRQKQLKVLAQPAITLLSAVMIALAISRFVFCRSRIFSSIVSRAMRR